MPPPPFAGDSFPPPGRGGPMPPPFAGAPPPPPREPVPYLLDAEKNRVTGPPGPPPPLQLHAIELNGGRVGYLGVPQGPPIREIAEARFEAGFTHYLLLVTFAMLVLSALLGIPLARALVRPLRRLTAATQALAEGRYDTRLPATSRDEIGVLERDINELASSLKQSEKTRRQWIADVSHELRTPIAVLRGEVEALQDGVRPFNSQALDSFGNEILRLARLVEDLYQLSLADTGALTYRKSEVEPLDLLDEALRSLTGDFSAHRIVLDIRLSGAGAVVYGDPDRLLQLFRNLAMNALRYTDPEGRLEVRSEIREDRLCIDFHDSEPGVPDGVLDHLFDRFFRVEGSRNRATGGAGLGLSICRAIVEAHAGTIAARPSPLGGLWIQLELPIEP